ncbi:metal-dependent hydrolase [Sphingomicrobium lutaoense]|uniref:Inner membrane protein n=1 Tax=Sphingomicrobium lutaoense TaxID=515949 RepID=A0A839Z133_9SPHN|nr:metal-dependent hydrolase [Sphingomicrobium lutaoense]MBB3763285.1 inner membrane protein [Sphingomicrobium lutaoense]
MDNLTHSLAGALLGHMGLRKRTPLAMPTLIIAANLPDLDAFATLSGIESLAVRRGITHGPLAMLVLPAILTVIMLVWNRWRPAKGEVRAGWLLLCAYIGTLSHPALDWLNSYGIRFLEPFSSRWFAGDTLFIIDLWVWGLLALGVFTSWRWQKRGRRLATAPAWTAFFLICGYIFANGLITGSAEQQAKKIVSRQWAVEPGLVVASPVPFKFWERKMLWRGGGVYGSGSYALFKGPRLVGKPKDTGLGDPRLAAARERPDVRAYLFWSRMPIVIEREGRAYLADQRFNGALVGDRFMVPLEDAPTG